ncbi:MAG: hypothetical protein IPK19_31460 [Chloroflexi bacterium]|nr:hypothetical protein [Chloroflexota bacterium]
MIRKDRSAILWCENATQLTGKPWQYVKVMQNDFEGLQPTTLADCAYFGSMQMSMFED